MTIPPRKFCPNDGATMVVTQNEAMGVDFKCPVCGLEKPHYQLD